MKRVILRFSLTKPQKNSWSVLVDVEVCKLILTLTILISELRNMLAQAVVFEAQIPVMVVPFTTDWP